MLSGVSLLFRKTVNLTCNKKPLDYLVVFRKQRATYLVTGVSLAVAAVAFFTVFKVA